MINMNIFYPDIHLDFLTDFFFTKLPQISNLCYFVIKKEVMKKMWNVDCELLNQLNLLTFVQLYICMHLID